MMRSAIAFLVLVLVTAAGCGAGNKTPTDGGGGGGGADGGGGGGGGAMACTTCILHGQWSVANISPCLNTTFSSDGGLDTVSAASSTFVSGAAVMCPTDFSAKPSEPWSTDTFQSDCPGHYRLCLTLKAGDPSNPLASDCTVASACAEGDDTAPNTAQTWTPVESWVVSSGAPLACAQQFHDNGGYGEMSVSGTASACGTVGRVFNRVTYCPLRCNANPSGPNCTNCGGGNSGTF